MDRGYLRPYTINLQTSIEECMGGCQRKNGIAKH